MSKQYANGISVKPLIGGDLEAALDAVADLRISVFRAFPYLYDGDHAYERRYLEGYRRSPDAILVGAFDGDRLVGAATGMRLTDHADDFAAAFADTGIAFGDGVLLRRIGAAARLAWARYRPPLLLICARPMPALSVFARSAFCAVLRPQDHPERPDDYRPLESFWCARGYRPLEGVVRCFPLEGCRRGRKKPPSRCSSGSAIWKTGPDPAAATARHCGGAPYLLMDRDRRATGQGKSGYGRHG